MMAAKPDPSALPSVVRAIRWATIAITIAPVTIAPARIQSPLVSFSVNTWLEVPPVWWTKWIAVGMFIGLRSLWRSDGGSSRFALAPRSSGREHQRR